MLPTKWNSSTSPTFAVTLSGLNTNPPDPAMITIVVASAVAAMAARMPIDLYIVFVEMI
jgi:hypothetical protein